MISPFVGDVEQQAEHHCSQYRHVDQDVVVAPLVLWCDSSGSGPWCWAAPVLCFLTYSRPSGEFPRTIRTRWPGQDVEVFHCKMRFNRISPFECLYIFKGDIEITYYRNYI